MNRLALFALTFLAACTVEDRAAAPNGAESKIFASPAKTGPAFFKTEAGPGEVFITLPKAGADGVSLRMIHASGLTAGLGSNPVGLDRGFAESGRIIAFRRIGKKVVIEQENWNYRASAESKEEREAVAQSFARSFLWTGEAVDESPTGTYKVNIASFLTSDVLNIKGILEAGGQGGYSIDAERSFVDADSVLQFPDNVEIDAFVTLTAPKAGGEVAATAADGRNFTLTLHHSFVRLPDDGFAPRMFDPRSGGIDAPFYDFSTPLGEPVIRKHAARFRLERKNPAAKSGPVKRPIVFYIDRGAPEPVRQALVDGAKWWADAFTAAGFEDAYRVELLPEGAHPMDVRYNVVEWTHRQTRGWSYGGGVMDPRTGEMLKAHVVLGSQRVRQDRMIFEGLAGAGKTGSGGVDDPIELSLARIRQLSAHEIGHTLGFAHNFAASTNDRASVMDYPAPYVRPTENGGLDFSGAYAQGIGEWDKVAAAWLYSQYETPEAEARGLEAIIRGAYARGLRFVDDAQARGVESAHPYAAVWDNGNDAAKTLDETMRVRAIALSNFGAGAIANGRPTYDLNAVIAPIYLYHRYQVDAAAKSVGGFEFRYAVKGDGPAGGRPVAAEMQRAALASLVATIDPAALDLPDATLNLLTPEMASFDGRSGASELLANDTAPMFDLLAAADSAASKTLGALLHPARLARLVEIERRDPSTLTAEETFAAIEQRLFEAPAPGRQAEIARRLQTRFVSLLIEIASGGAAAGEAQAASLGLSFGPGAIATPEVRFRTNAYLKSLRRRLDDPAQGDEAPIAPADEAQRAGLSDLITAHLARPAPSLAPGSKAPALPPGSPIGSMEDCWFCDMRRD